MPSPDVRTLFMETFQELAQSTNSGALDVLEVCNQVLLKVGKRGTEIEQEILTHYYDLFRVGILSWGWDAANARPPYVHLTAHGRRSVASSRDPSNKVGYLAAIDATVPAGSVARSYIDEALDTYASGCAKATAVLTGGAAEALVLDLRDTLVAKMSALKKSIHNDLTHWIIKRVLDRMEVEYDAAKKAMPRALQERYSSFWGSFTGQLRLARNDAGHPTSISPVTVEVVHSSLLIFPALAELIQELEGWTVASYT